LKDLAHSAKAEAFATMKVFFAFVALSACLLVSGIEGAYVLTCVAATALLRSSHAMI
jgi:hypothetical protein